MDGIGSDEGARQRDEARARARARDPEWRDRAQAVADELRAAAEALSTRAPSLEQLVKLEAQARSLRGGIDGPLRPRWYEDLDRVRDAFGDLSPVRGRFNPIAPPTRLERLAVDGRQVIELRATLGMAYEGPPLAVHGGWVAALWDDVLGEAQMLAESGSGMTAWIKVRYRRPTPIGRELCFRGWVEKEQGRRLECRGRCELDGELLSEAEGLFVRVDFEQVEARLRGAD